MEGTHRQLRARFADGLRGNHAHCFAEFHHATRCQVAAIAQRADAATGFAGEHRADSNAFNTRSLYGISKLFGNFLGNLDDYVAFEVLDLVE